MVVNQSVSFYKRMQPWIVVFSAAMFFFFEFTQLNMFNSLNPYLYRDFHLKSTAQLGGLAACYMYANVLFLFPAGVLLDRFSTRVIILLAMLSCVTSTLLFSFSQYLWQAEICRFVTGIGGAFCLLSAVRVASRWFPPQRMALIVGLVVTFAMSGAMIAQTPFTILAHDFGWRTTLLINALVGYAMLAVIMFFVKDFPEGDRAAIEHQHHVLHDAGFLRPVLQAFGSLQNWMAGLYASLTNLPVFILGSWGIMFLHQAHHMSREQASVVTSAMFVGLMVGSPFFGWISDRLGQRRLPMLLGGFFCLLSVLPIIIWAQLSFTALLITFFLIGFMSSAQIISYAVVSESNPLELTGVAESLASILIMSGGFLIPLFAVFLNIGWHPHYLAGVPQYALHQFRQGLLLMPVAFVLSIIAAFVVKETHCRSFNGKL
jgi:MFS family permease